MGDLNWVDGLIFTLGAFAGAYLKKFGVWLKAKLAEMKQEPPQS